MPYLGVRAGSVIVIYPGDDDDDDVWESPSFLESRGEMYDSEDDDKDDDEECASSGPGGSKPKQPAPHSKKPSFRKPAAQRGGWKKVRDAADFEEETWLLFRRNAVHETSRNWVFKYSKTLRNGSKTAVYKCGDDNCDAELKVTREAPSAVGEASSQPPRGVCCLLLMNSPLAIHKTNNPPLVCYQTTGGLLSDHRGFVIRPPGVCFQPAENKPALGFVVRPQMVCFQL